MVRLHACVHACMHECLTACMLHGLPVQNGVLEHTQGPGCSHTTSHLDSGAHGTPISKPQTYTSSNKRLKCMAANRALSLLRLAPMLFPSCHVRTTEVLNLPLLEHVALARRTLARREQTACARGVAKRDGPLGGGGGGRDGRPSARHVIRSIAWLRSIPRAVVGRGRAMQRSSAYPFLLRVPPSTCAPPSSIALPLLIRHARVCVRVCARAVGASAGTRPAHTHAERTAPLCICMACVSS